MKRNLIAIRGHSELFQALNDPLIAKWLIQHPFFFTTESFQSDLPEASIYFCIKDYFLEFKSLVAKISPNLSLDSLTTPVACISILGSNLGNYRKDLETLISPSIKKAKNCFLVRSESDFRLFCDDDMFEEILAVFQNL